LLAHSWPAGIVDLQIDLAAKEWRKNGAIDLHAMYRAATSHTLHLRDRLMRATIWTRRTVVAKAKEILCAIIVIITDILHARAIDRWVPAAVPTAFDYADAGIRGDDRAVVTDRRRANADK
jgi:hypothetical protein